MGSLIFLGVLVLTVMAFSPDNKISINQLKEGQKFKYKNEILVKRGNKFCNSKKCYIIRRGKK